MTAQNENQALEVQGHLPECWYFDPDKALAATVNPRWPCICYLLRACEQRVVREIVSDDEWKSREYRNGFDDALDAAEAAVDDLDKYVHGQIDAADALATIRALKEKP